MKRLFILSSIFFILFFAAISSQGWAQVTGDFQTKNAIGNWSNFNSWNIYNGSAWVAATPGQRPAATSNVFVQAAHRIIVDNANARCNDLNINGATSSKIAFSAGSVLNVKGNMALFDSSHDCFGPWNAGAKIVFSGTGAQGFTNLSIRSVFVNIEVNKSSGTLTTSSNFKFGSFTLTAGNFLVGLNRKILGSSASSTIDINGGTWTQINGRTRIYNSAIDINSPIGNVNINGGSMILQTSTKVSGFQFSTINVSNGGTLTLNHFLSDKITIGTSISVDATSTFNTALSNLTLPSSVTFSGVVNYNYSGAQTISPATYTNLTFSAPGDKTAPPGILTINGNLSNTGGSVFVHNNGTVLFSNTTTSQSYTSISPGFTFYNLKNSNTSGTGLLVNNDMAIEGVLTLDASSKLTLDGYITLKSNAVTTAIVAEVPASATINYGAGLFVVERYFSPKRAWRFLSVPANTFQSIKDAWQEGAAFPNSSTQNPVPGYGTQITNNVIPDITNGFDYYSPNGPSVKKYDQVNNIWAGIPGTNIPIATNEGIMTFVRGDRTANSLNAPATPTVLRTQGQLYVGTQPDITITTGKFASIGNPYAAALDMRKIITTNVDSFFYVWDPKLTGNGFGAFQTFYFSGNNFYPIPGFGSYGDPSVPYNYIQSGQAFFVTNSGAVNGSVSITESAKASADSPSVNNTSVFRPANSPPLQLFRTTLYSVNANETGDVLDGVLNLFGNDFSNVTGKEYTVKIKNFAENLGIKNKDKLLSIEKGKTINKHDTIQLNLTNLNVRSYRFIFRSANFNQSGLTAYLEDIYLNTLTSIDLNDATIYNFNVTEDAGSRNPDRFRILFNEAEEGPLPITFISVKAYQQNGNIRVEWNVENEKNIKDYVVEKSGDGQQFTLANIFKAKGNTSNTINYQWLDENPVPGKNYYRIRGVSLNGEIQYSAVVNVILGKGKQQILVNPNPIIGNTINLQLINQPKGKFNLKLLNTAGQVLSASTINHEEGSSSETIKINKVIPGGIYLLKITGRDNNELTFKIFK